MRKGILISLFWGLIIFWAYEYPYQWWLKYGQTEVSEVSVNKNDLKESLEAELPKPFLGSSLVDSTKQNSIVVDKKNPINLTGIDLAGPIMDEIKTCFGEGPLASLSSSGGDLNSLVMSLQNQLGPVQEDLLLEKKVVLKMKDGQTRTLVYEWISPEEGSDVYWHETDEEGFPRPIDLPEGSGHDLATFDQLKQQGNASKSSETRLIELQKGLQLGVEKTDDVIKSVSLKDDGHLAKCRRDPVKSYVCDCLN